MGRRRANPKPGSPMSLRAFHSWCHIQVVLAASRQLPPAFLFASGPRLKRPFVLAWTPEDGMGPKELFENVFLCWIEITGASQVGVAIPLSWSEENFLLLALDETGVLIGGALTDETDDEPGLMDWASYDLTSPAVLDCQRLLARNAGYHDFSKWRCGRCRSVCCGEAGGIPRRCPYCKGDDIAEVSLDTRLVQPRPPYHERYEPDCSGFPPIPTLIGDVLDLIIRQPRS
jgi:hypothetical protein